MKLEGLELATFVAKAALDKKANDLICLDVRGKVDYADFLVICEGTSDRHVQAIAESINAELRAAKCRPLGVEGEQGGQWVLMDCGDVVVHVFYYQVRHIFELEKLWADATEIPIEDSGATVAKSAELA